MPDESIVMLHNPLSRLLDKIQDSETTRSVWIVGDIMLDRFVYGAVERISPEGPIPVLRVKRQEHMLGGAGNALANLAGFGMSGRIFSVIGDDAEGRLVREHVAALGYATAGLVVDPARPTIVKTRFLAGHQQLLRTDFESKDPVSFAVQEQLLKDMQDSVEDVGCIMMSDYGKGMLSPEIISRIMALACARQIPVVVDPKGQDFTIYRGAYAITPNRKELSDATKGSVTGTDQEICRAADHIIETCGIDAVVATRSGDGMSVIQKGADPVHLRTTDIEVFDVSGAGDTVIATIASVLAVGGTLVESAALANLAGSLVVTKVGTAPVRLGELKALLETDQGDHMTHIGRERQKADRMRRADILDWNAAAEQVRRWKARGLVVGFTNGCFDILHFGHVTYLNQARDRCDRLIVGLNTDASVTLLKGPARPVHEERSRATVLAGLGSVDMVVLFGAREEGEDNTASALLNLIKPDVYFKGGDYLESQIPEAPTVKTYGGRVEIMPAQDGHSSTASLTRLRG